MHRELIPRTHPRRAAHDVPPVEHKPARAQDWGEFREPLSEGSDQGPDGDTVRRDRPKELGLTDSEPSGRE